MAGFLAAPLSSQAERFPSSFPVFVVFDSFPTVRLFPLDWGPEFSFPLAPWCLSFRCKSSDRTPVGSVSRVFVRPRLKRVCTEVAVQPPVISGTGFGRPLAFGARVSSLVVGAGNGSPLAGCGVNVLAAPHEWVRVGADFGAPVIGGFRGSLCTVGADDGSPIVGFTARAGEVAAVPLAAVDGSSPGVAGHQSAGASRIP